MKIFFNKQWTLFLDRDGVINRRPINDYVKKPADFEFLPAVTEAIRLLSGIFGRIIVVTNQQGVGLGLMTAQSLDEIHRLMLEKIEESGGKIDAVFSCTELKTNPDNCRKPSMVMGEKALEAFPEIRFEQSVMLGDTQSDILFGKNFGMKTIQIGSEKLEQAADLKFDTLYQFARYCQL